MIDYDQLTDQQTVQYGLAQLRIVLLQAAEKIDWVSCILKAPENEHIPAELRAELRASITASRRILEYGSSAISNLPSGQGERARALTVVAETVLQIASADVPITPILDAIAAQRTEGSP